MSQGSQLRNRRGRVVSFEDPVSTHDGPSSSASAPVAWPTSIQAAPIPATQGPPTPTIKVTPVLDPYRPVSRDYRGPPSLMQAAWAAAPMPKSFLEAIAQANDIRENTYKTSNADFGPLAGPVTMPPATVPLPDWPADIITPPQQPAFPAFRSSTDIATGHVTQPVGPTVPSGSSSYTISASRPTPRLATGHVAQPFRPTVSSENSSSAVSSGGRPTPRLPPGLYSSTSTGAVYGPAVPWQRLPGTSPYGLANVPEESDFFASSSTAPPSSVYSGQVTQPSGPIMTSDRSYGTASPTPLPPVYSSFEGGSYGSPFSSSDVTPRAGPVLPSESSSSTASSCRSSPHLGSNLFAPGLRAPPGSLYDDQFVPPALPTPAVVSSGRSTTPHLGSGLSAPMDANTASSLRLAHVFESTARPYQQPPTYYEPGYYGPEPEPRNQHVGSGGQSSYQATYQPTYQAPFSSDPRATYEYAPQTTYQAPPFDPRATDEYAPQPQSQYFGYGRDPLHRPSVYEEQTTYGPQPMQYVQPNRPNTGYPQHDGSRLLSPVPEPPTVRSASRRLSPVQEPPTARSGSAASSRGEPNPSPERETRDAALANLEQAERQANLAELRVGVRREQLKNIDKKLQTEKEEERVQQEDEFQWRPIERREAKRAHRR